jgi:hypothetical protein
MQILIHFAYDFYRVADGEMGVLINNSLARILTLIQIHPNISPFPFILDFFFVSCSCGIDASR